MSFHNNNIMNSQSNFPYGGNQSNLSVNSDFPTSNNQMLYQRQLGNRDFLEDQQIDLRVYYNSFKTVNFKANFDRFSEKIP